MDQVRRSCKQVSNSSESLQVLVLFSAFGHHPKDETGAKWAGCFSSSFYCKVEQLHLALS